MRIQRIKLNALSEAQLHDKEMNAILGGSYSCECSCYYEGQPGGSTSADNAVANSGLNIISPVGCNNTTFDPEIGLGVSGKVTA